MNYREIISRHKNSCELIRLHHRVMKEYGWIPFEEFRKLPIPTVVGLMGEIGKDNIELERRNKRWHRTSSKT